MSEKKAIPSALEKEEQKDRKRVPSLYVLLIAGLATVVLVYWMALMIDPQKKLESVKSRFFTELNEQIELGMVQNLQDVEMVRLGVSQLMNNEQLMSDDLEGLLSEFLITVNSKTDADNTRHTEKSKAIKNIISVLRTEKPFSILPKEDQLTAIELRKAIESGTAESALSRLEVLTESVGKHISTLNARADGSYRWAIFGAIAGIIGIAWAVIISVIKGGSSKREYSARMYDRMYRMQQQMEVLLHQISTKEKQ